MLRCKVFHEHVEDNIASLVMLPTRAPPPKGTHIGSLASLYDFQKRTKGPSRDAHQQSRHKTLRYRARRGSPLLYVVPLCTF